MASQGPLIAQRVLQTNLSQAGRLRWDQPNNVLADDATVATCAVSPATYRDSYRLAVSQFGFTIPANSIITGIEFSFEANTNITLGPQCRDGTAEIMMDPTGNGAVEGQILSSGSLWSAGIHARQIGGSGNLWGWTPTYADINDGNFTISFDVQVASGNTASIDYCACTVYYSTVNTDSFAGTGGVGVQGTGLVANPWYFGFGQGSFGIGVAGAGGRYHASKGTHGLGVGGTADFKRRAAFTGTHGMGVGGTFVHGPRLASYGGTHGLGIGGYGEYTGSIYRTGTVGAGLGGTSGWRFAEGGTHGIGVGGTGGIFRRAAFVGTHGIGAGYGTGNFIRIPAFIGTHGIGVGGEGTAWKRVYSFGGTSTPGGRIGGFGVAGAGAPKALRDGETINPEDDIDRSHRGPVTRRMVFDAIHKALVNGPLDKYRVYISDDEPDMNNVPPGETFAVIIPSSASNNQGDAEGGGSLGTMRTDGCQVRVYSHLSIDQNLRATAFNLKIDTGAMERARKVRRTLHLLDLIDGGGWLLLSEPMRATTTGIASFKRVNPQWGYYAENFEIVFTEYLG